MSTLPAGLATGPMDPRDVDNVVVLLQLVEMRTIGQIETSPADLGRWIATPGIHLKQDSGVVRNGPRVDGWWLVERAGPHALLSVHSHPDWWDDPRLDVWLLEQAVHRALQIVAEDDAIVAVVMVTPEDDHRRDMLAACGFELARRHRRMEIRFDRRSPDVPSPTDVVLRNPDGEDDLRAIHQLIVGAFTDQMGRAPSSWEHFATEHVRHEDFDPSLWFVAESARPDLGASAHGGILGAIVARDDKLARAGWVAQFAVRDEARGRGIGLALLTSTFRAFHERGVGRVELSVDSDSEFGAASLYERAGMREQAVLLRHRLTPQD